MICLDTNVVIAVLKQEPAHLLERFARELPQGTLALSTIVLFELQYGIANSARRKENTDRLAVFRQAPVAVLPFEPEDAEEAGELRAELKRAGTPIGPYTPQERGASNGERRGVRSRAGIEDRRLDRRLSVSRRRMHGDRASHRRRAATDHCYR
jgi:tRNA(fMet)-specific endonuclease VapC